MDSKGHVPADPMEFIRLCAAERRILWTYHVNMRMKGRGIPRGVIIGAVDSYEIIEEYPGDKYMPSYLIWMKANGEVYHVLFALDVEGNNVRVVTAYRPDPAGWDGSLKKRRR